MRGSGADGTCGSRLQSECHPWVIDGAPDVEVCEVQAHASGGVRCLWAGLWPTIVRAFPANAMQWLVYEYALRAIGPPSARPDPLDVID